MVSDNHGSNDKLLREFAARLKREGLLLINLLQRRIRCYGHILNIAAQAFLFAKDKEAIDAAFEATRLRLERDPDIDDDQIDKILAKKFKKKATTKTYIYT